MGKCERCGKKLGFFSKKRSIQLAGGPCSGVPPAFVTLDPTCFNQVLAHDVSHIYNQNACAPENWRIFLLIYVPIVVIVAVLLIVVGVFACGSGNGPGCFLGMFLGGFLGGSAVIITPFMYWSMTTQNIEKKLMATKWRYEQQLRNPSPSSEPAMIGLSTQTPPFNSQPSISAPPYHQQQQHAYTPSAPHLSLAPNAAPPYSEAMDGRPENALQAQKLNLSAPKFDEKEDDYTKPPPLNPSQNNPKKQLNEWDGNVSSADAKDVSCVVCFDSPREMVLLPCKHMVTCESCTAKLTDKLCPMCRATFHATMRIHLS